MKAGTVAEGFEFALPRPLAIVLVFFPFLAATVVSVVFADRLPEIIPLHWTMFGQADAAVSQFVILALFPALQLMHLLAGSPSRHRNRRNHPRIRFGLLLGIVLLVVQAAWFATHAGPPITEAFLIPVFIGGLLAVAGFFMSESKPNMFFGIRTSWTLGDARVWEQTHKTAGPVTMVTGGLCVVFGILLSPPVAIGATLGITLLSAAAQLRYSYFVARKLRNQRLAKMSA